MDLWTWALHAVAALLKQVQPPERLVLGGRAYDLGPMIGEGGFAYVYEVRESQRPDSRALALKRVRIALPEHRERIQNEIAAHHAVRSPHVIPLIASELRAEPPEALLLLPLYRNGTVQDLIERSVDPDHGLPIKQILSITKDVCAGLAAFHKHEPPLAFRDLKPGNILVGDAANARYGIGPAVLTDLGSVAPAVVRITSRREAVALQELCAETVTAPFRAPELFDPPSTATIDAAVDVWALGCTLFTMAYGTPPFDGTLTAVVSGQVTFPGCPSGAPHVRVRYTPAFQQLIRDILTLDPSMRPSLAEISVRCDQLLANLNQQQQQQQV
ncbi:hypothetical protein CXG81DRAFT_13808 [Caulochytrium protostelioides]|uniref:non-specific serine/threonine protein kinase n=1 Tax=Caulochytrium protostelioides TaxID=1555241 RepID=A0A4P9X4F7_9FUNG|nr:hypothetical protein CXG81DRAFT_13808 [Caulochytrium protostelioides]|eukprot:RKO99957.1 hypothetical protein CXG81DRAFT_13808 [Caulochytrium protostelioides]